MFKRERGFGEVFIAKQRKMGRVKSKEMAATPRNVHKRGGICRFDDLFPKKCLQER
jgi:hypothetical protein